MRISEELLDPRFADGLTLTWAGSRVDLYFHHLAEESDGSVGEVVAHLFMSLDQFMRLPTGMEAVLEKIDPRLIPDESPDFGSPDP
jgi:hypothetical protein